MLSFRGGINIKDLNTVPAGSGMVSWLSLMQAYVKSSQVPRWYRFNETSGNLINYGYVSGLNSTALSATQGETGKLGPYQAYLFDGVTNYARTPGGTTANLDTFTHLFLVKIVSHLQNRRWLSWGSSNSRISFDSATLTRMTFVREFSGDDVDFTVTATLPIGVWFVLFITHDMGGDRKARVYYDTTGTGVSLLATAPLASTGTITNYSLSNYTFAVRDVPDQNSNIMLDEYALFNVALSTVQMNVISALLL